jgi:hypothetical protein
LSLINFPKQSLNSGQLYPLAKPSDVPLQIALHLASHFQTASIYPPYTQTVTFSGVSCEFDHHQETSLLSVFKEQKIQPFLCLFCTRGCFCEVEELKAFILDSLHDKEYSK